MSFLLDEKNKLKNYPIFTIGETQAIFAMRDVTDGSYVDGKKQSKPNPNANKLYQEDWQKKQRKNYSGQNFRNRAKERFRRFKDFFGNRRATDYFKGKNNFEGKKGGGGFANVKSYARKTKKGGFALVRPQLRKINPKLALAAGAGTAILGAGGYAFANRKKRKRQMNKNKKLA